MGGLEWLKEYFKNSPEVAKRIAIVTVIVAIAAPLWWYSVGATDERAYVHLTNGYYYYRNRNYDAAVNSLRQLVDLYPNSTYTPLGRYYYGMAFIEMNNLDEAAAQFQMILDRNPKHFLRDRVYALRMAIELQAGRPGDAVAIADRYLAEFPNDAPTTPEILYRKGVALIHLGRPDEASACFASARERAGDNNIFSNFALYAQTARTAM